MAMSDYRNRAAAMDLHMRQLANEGIVDQAVPEHMAPFPPDLHTLLTKTNNDQLSLLYRDYLGFYRYALLMESADEAERQIPSRLHDGLPELPDTLKLQLTMTLASGVALQRSYQRALDASGRPETEVAMTGLSNLRASWDDDLMRLETALSACAIPLQSRDIILTALKQISREIHQLEKRASER